MSSLLMESLGWALLHSLWQGALVALLLAVALATVGRRAASARYVLACGALVMALALPVATGWRHYAQGGTAVERGTAGVAVLERGTAPHAVERSAAPHAVERNTAPHAVERGTAGVAALERGMAKLTAPHAVEQSTAGEAAPRAGEGGWVAAAVVPLLERVRSAVEGALYWLVLAWVGGVGLCSGRMAAEWVKLRRLASEALPAPAEWQGRLDVLAGRLGLKRAVRLLQSSAIDVPAAVGWLSPVVLLPVSALSGLPARQLEMVLAHELAHIRRHDFAVNLAQVLVETLLFYHPAVRWVSHVIRVEREHCCDDVAVGASGSSLSYARALTALETLRVMPGTPGPAMSALGGSLPERVRRLVSAPATRCSSRWVAGASVLTLASSLAVAAPLTSLVLGRVGAESAPEKMAVPAPAPAPLPGMAAVPAPAPAPAPAPLPGMAAMPAPPAPPAPAPRPDRRGDDDADERTVVGSGQRLSVDQLVALKVAGVTPARVQELQAMGYAPTVANLVQMGHAGITSEYAKEMNSRFGRTLDADDLTQLRHLGVTPAYIETLKSAGFATNDPDDLVQARAVGVDEAYVRALKDAGYSGLSLEDVSQLRAVGVNAAYIDALGKHGLGKLSADDLTQLRAVGVTPEWLSTMREAGIQTKDADELTQLRAMGVTPAFLRELRDAGLEDLSIDDIIQLRAGGVDADFIQKLRGSRAK